ncbi:alpha/beta fold hydrolase [Acinetobacter larvae]|uniref:Alpha/beta hydrolase n=1 Tax=Acinetobacter larvae TaxID=1789224 RepID=A0A1B2M3A5_9GAMM|nr:alpha/beta hydrolase [Acinetobacter larvae]AOA59678.1 alpha/beta hydrolase [Acinetobacter larvae]
MFKVKQSQHCGKKIYLALLCGFLLQSPAFAAQPSFDFPTPTQQHSQPFSLLKSVAIDAQTQLATRYKPGEGTPIVFVHGSWDDHHSWLAVAEQLAQQLKNPIILYDRRGHSASTPDQAQGTITQDVKDAIALTKALGFEQAHFIGHSYGANIVMQLAEQYPLVAKSIVLYEPPLFGLLKGKAQYQNNLQQVQTAMQSAKQSLEQGDIEKGSIEFIEQVAFGANSWQNLFDERARATMLASYRTWLDQANDPERLNLKAEPLNQYSGRISILYGTDSIAAYQNIITELDHVLKQKKLLAIPGAGHGGLVSHSDQTTQAIVQHLR